jgi:hypothetical protein
MLVDLVTVALAVVEPKYDTARVRGPWLGPHLTRGRPAEHLCTFWMGCATD